MRWVAVAVGLTIGTLVFFFTREVAIPVTPRVVIEAPTLAPVAPVAAAVTPGLSAPTPPDSLRGTEQDGDIELDEQGHLRITRGLRRRFDYWLAANGELTPPAIRAAIADSAPPSVREPVLEVFDRYASYLLAVSALHPVDSSPKERLRLLKALRREKLGEDLARIFYGEEEAFDEQRVHLDPEQDLSVLQAQTAQFEAQHTSAADRFKEREAAFGTEAATRLAALDETRAKWQARLEAYRTQLTALEQDTSLSAEAKAAAKQRVLETAFPDETERRRVSAH